MKLPLLSLSLVAVVGMLSDASAQKPRFEVASVKENVSPDRGVGRLFPQVQIVGAPLYMLIAAAHGVELKPFRLYLEFSKIPQEGLEKRFDITAKGEGDQRAMLRTLLEETISASHPYGEQATPVVRAHGRQAWSIGSSSASLYDQLHGYQHPRRHLARGLHPR
jgi:hypothetical protein